MQQAVVRSAQEKQPVGAVVPAFGARGHVVNLQERDVAAARDSTSAAVAPHDGPPDCRRDGLRGAPRLRAHADAHVGVDPLRVARGAFGELGAHLDALAAALLPGTAAAVADRHGHLVGRAPVVRGAAQDLARHLHDGLLVGEARVHVAAQPRHRLAEERERLGR